jgi:hypothetical protein
MDRQIFTYEVNGETRRADPLAVWDRLIAALHAEGMTTEDMVDRLKLFENPAPEVRLPAGEFIGRIARAAFRLKDIEDEENGVTRVEAAHLLGSYFAWENDVRKKHEPSPSTAPSIDAQSEKPTKPSATATSGSKPCMACG